MVCVGHGPYRVGDEDAKPLAACEMVHSNINLVSVRNNFGNEDLLHVGWIF